MQRVNVMYFSLTKNRRRKNKFFFVLTKYGVVYEKFLVYLSNKKKSRIPSSREERSSIQITNDDIYIHLLFIITFLEEEKKKTFEFMYFWISTTHNRTFYFDVYEKNKGK